MLVRDEMVRDEMRAVVRMLQHEMMAGIAVRMLAAGMERIYCCGTATVLALDVD